MGIFSGRTKRIIQELRRKSEFYSSDLSREISEKLEELKADYDENSDVLPDFTLYVEELKCRLNPEDCSRLEEFAKRFAIINRNAEKGVDALWELSKNQRKLIAENRLDFADIEESI